MLTGGGGCIGKKRSKSGAAADDRHKQKHQQQQQQLCKVHFILSALRKSVVSTCSVDRDEHETISSVHHMEIGQPTNVQHLTHVTFDRFHGFLGLPVEFELEIPCTAPSSSRTRVCGASGDSMQWSNDAKGNTVPTILLLMQETLYAQGGLKAEGIFRVNPEDSEQEHVRDLLNRGIVPENRDVHCLAGLIKAWFRERPSGVLDGLSPAQVLNCKTEEEFVELVQKIKPTDKALLLWAIDLMADVVDQEEHNKMNARNIAMVFAPNMTRMSDPLTALMHAVQVMNLLRMLIVKTLRERDEEYDRWLHRGTSCVSTGPGSDEEAEAHYSPSYDEDKEEVGSLSEIGDCFLRQMDMNLNAKDGFRKQLERILCRDHSSPRSGFT